MMSARPAQQSHIGPMGVTDFAQSVDKTRPRELLVQKDSKGRDLDPSRTWDLRYRYLDTGETVTVPNVHYNHTPQMRQSTLQWYAHCAMEHAQRVQRDLNRLTESVRVVRTMPGAAPARPHIAFSDEELKPMLVRQVARCLHNAQRWRELADEEGRGVDLHAALARGESFHRRYDILSEALVPMHTEDALLPHERIEVQALIDELEQGSRQEQEGSEGSTSGMVLRERAR